MYNINVIIYSLVAGVSTILGTALLFYKEAWSKRNSIYLLSFAAGVMLAIAFLHLMPEALSLADDALLAVLLGIIAFYILQRLIDFHPCHDEECRLHNMGIVSLVGLSFHSLLDGIAIALGFGVGAGLGIMTAIAVLLHEFPEGITTTSILMYAGMRRVKIIAYSIMVAVATPVGAIFFYPIIKGMSDKILGLLLAVAAGSFIYIASADLIPQTHRTKNKMSAILLVLGVVFLALVSKLIE